MPLPIPPSMLPLVIAGGVFLLIVAIFVLIARSMGRDAPDMGDRLSQYAGRQDREPATETRAFARLDAAVAKGKQGSQIARDLARADLKLTVTEFIGLKILAAVLGAGLGAFVGRASSQAMILSALVGAVLLSFAPNLYVAFTARRRVRAFNDQLGDTINLLANALRSGYSFLQSLDLVSREAPAPTATEFRRVTQEVQLGISTADALQNLLRRVPSDDLDLLITAVSIQMEVGGNLAQILDTIGHTIRERVRIKGEIAVLTAQGRISAYVITGLPIALAIFISVVNPSYMAPLFTFGLPPKAWCCLPVAGMVMIVIGFFAIMKIVDIEV